MKKFLTVIFLLAVQLILFGIEKKENETIRRTIAILPFYNQNSVEKYDYLSDTIRDSLKAKLVLTESFIITSFSLIDDKIKKYKLTISEAISDKNTKRLAKAVKSDIAVTGKFIIIEDKIMVSIEVIDIFSESIVATSRINGEVGLDLFRIINKVTEDITEKINSKFKKVDSTYFSEMSKALKKQFLRSIFTPMRVTGITLTASGSCLFITGMPLLIFDLANYSASVRYDKDYGPLTNTGYRTYYDSYWTFVGLLSGSIALASTGLILLSIGIPLIIYDSKRQKTSFDIYLKKESIYFSMKWKL
ncbi:MAG: hypothetical protein JXB50_00550 [Spirochaetes bacterium]|nr:hypothetical protein [Spirochaetota bacterium]